MSMEHPQRQFSPGSFSIVFSVRSIRLDDANGCNIRYIRPSTHWVSEDESDHLWTGRKLLSDFMSPQILSMYSLVKKKLNGSILTFVECTKLEHLLINCQEFGSFQ